MNMRAALAARIEQAKAKASKTKPLGIRVESCKVALLRAKRRAEDGEAAVAAAILVRDQAAADVGRYTEELHELEAELYAQSAMSQGSLSFSRLQTEMSTIITQMATSTYVEESDAAAIKNQMAVLFQHLSAVSARATAASQEHLTAVQQIVGTQSAAAAAQEAQAAGAAQAPTAPPEAVMEPASVSDGRRSLAEAFQRGATCRATPAQAGMKADDAAESEEGPLAKVPRVLGRAGTQ